MADIILTQPQQLPSDTLVRYADMGDGTHSLVVQTRTTASAGSDIVRSAGGSLPNTMRTRYVDQGDGTHALVQAWG